MQTAEKKTELNGIFDISNEEYHAHSAISNTGLGHILRSPAHYVAHRNEPQKPTDAKALGSAVHFGILQPELFYQKYVGLPEKQFRTKSGEIAQNGWATTEGKAFFADLAKANAGKEILDMADFEKVERMIEEAYSHPTVSAYLKGGAIERSFMWTDPVTGVACKSRPDYLRNDGIIVDLKTTDSAEYGAFQRSVGKYAYYRQAAFGMDGLKHVLGREQTGFVLIAIEKEPPYGIGVYVLDEAAIAAGRIEYKEGLAIFAECAKKDNWPGYPEGTQSLSLPRWMQ